MATGQTNFLDYFCSNFSTWARDFLRERLSRSQFFPQLICVQRCSQRQVSNPQTSVTVLRSKITSAATKSIHSIQNFPHENSESFVHRRPTVWRTETVFSPWEYAAVTYEQLYYIYCFMIEMGNQESHSIKMPYCVPFSILSNWSLGRFALAVASLWSKFLQPWSK